MSSEALLRRLGMAGGTGDARVVWAIVGGILLLYAAGFLAWYPSIPTNTDERVFLNQTQALTLGVARVEKRDPFTEGPAIWIPGTYAPGAPLLMAPFVAMAGLPGAYLVPGLSVLVAVLILGRWLQEEGRSPLFALLALGFPATLVMGRVAMSDAPSLALVALGLWLFWRGLDRGGPWWLLSGFVAGGSMTLRITNCLPFIPLYAGTVLRRERRCWALVVGGLAGVGVRMLASIHVFGDPFHEKDYYPYAPWSIGERLPLYLLGLLVLVPGGLVAALAYRGRRRPELVSTVLLFLAFYLFQEYDTHTTSFLKRTVLALRYFMEVLPWLVFAMAEAVPRGWRRLAIAREGRAGALGSLLAAAVTAWLTGLAVAALSVHVYMHRWSEDQGEIARTIDERIGDTTVLVTNKEATRKFLRQFDLRYMVLSPPQVDSRAMRDLVRRHGEVVIALLDRSDSAYWRTRSGQNDLFVDSLDPPPVLEVDRRISPTNRLRIWRARRPPE